MVIWVRELRQCKARLRQIGFGWSFPCRAGVGFAAATMRACWFVWAVGCELWAAVQTFGLLGWAGPFGAAGFLSWSGCCCGAQKARGCWPFISHQSFIIYHSRSNCYFPCRRGSRDVRCDAKPKSVEGTCPCPFILCTFLGGLVWFLVRFLLFWFLPH